MASRPVTSPDELRRASVFRLGAVALLLVAWALLLFRLDQAPPGFQHDQMFNSRDALEVLEGRFQFYFPANFGREPLGIYASALSFLLAGGRYVWSLRFATVVWGLLTLALTLVLARRYLARPAALLAGALLAGSFWFIFVARLGLEPAALIPFTLVMLYFIALGQDEKVRRRPRLLYWMLAGVFAGLALYTYPAARALFGLPVLLLGYELVRWLVNRWRPLPFLDALEPRQAVLGAVVVLAVMLLVAAPLFLYVAAHPVSADQRLRELSGALTAARQGDVAPLAANVFETLKAIVWEASYAIPYQYNLPGRAVLQPLWALFFLAGLAQTLMRWRHRSEFLLVAALLAGLSTSMLSGADALHMRGVIALPLIYILTARGVAGVAAWIALTSGALRAAPATRRRLGIAGIVSVVVLVAWHAVVDTQAYFGAWALAEPTQRIYNADLRAAAAYLDARPGEAQVFLGTDRLFDLDALTYALYEPQMTDVRWFHLPESAPLPSHQGALYLFPAGASETSAPLELLAQAGAAPVRLPADQGGYDLMEGFRLGQDDLDLALAAKGVGPVDKPPVYGDAMKLDAAGIRQHGDMAELVTVWTVLAPYPRTAAPGLPPAVPKYSLSLTDATGYQWQQFDAPTKLPFLYWRQGDRFVDVTRIPLPADLPAGDYAARLVVYDDIGGALPITRDGAFVALAPVVANLTATDPVTGAAPPPPHANGNLGAGSLLQPLGRWEALDSIVVDAPFEVRVSWQAGQDVDTSGLRFYLRSRSTDGSLLGEQEARPLAALPARWAAGQTYRLTHQAPALQTPVDVGIVKLELCAVRDGADLGCLDLGAPEVRRQPPIQTLPATPQAPVDARWNGQFALEGYDAGRGDGTLDVVLYWRVLAPPATPVWRYLHGLDAQDHIVAQVDGPPANGELPITRWRPGEVVVDRIQLPISSEQEIAMLRLGWYNPETGERIAVQRVSGGEGPGEDLRLPLASEQ